MKKKILYSPGYGAGWSSWNDYDVGKFMAEYQPIIEAIENGEKMCEVHPLVLKMVNEIKQKFNKDYVCVAGARDLEVRCVNGAYKIEDHDGFESVTESYEWW